MAVSEMAGDPNTVLVEALVGEGYAQEAITVREEAGPLGTRRLVASAPGAYPGAGVKSAIVDGNRAYGADFPDGLGALFAARGWLASPPDPGSVAALVNLARFGGMLAFDPDSDPVLSRSDDTLTVEIIRRAFPSNARERVRVRLAAGRPDEVTIESAEPPPAPGPIPIDAVTALIRAVAAGAPMDVLARLRAFPSPTTARERSALAAAATSGNDMIAATAMLKLGDSDEAAAALREALSSQPSARRSALVELARDAHGAAFAARLG